MSAGYKLRCGECVTWQRVTLNGRIYKHGDCPGGGKDPLNETADNEAVVKSGFSPEQFDLMLAEITPARPGFLARVRSYFRRP